RGGEVDVTVDECRCDETTIEVDDLRVRKLLAPNIISAKPSNDAVGHSHCRGIGHRGAVHPSVEEESRHLLGVLVLLACAKLALHGRGFNVDDVDDLSVDVVTASRGVISPA